MWQFLYIIAFVILAGLTISNLFRNMLTLGAESREPPRYPSQRPNSSSHPELLDDEGQMINEPLLVMRSMSMDDAREHLDSLYNQSPGSNDETRGEI